MSSSKERNEGLMKTQHANYRLFVNPLFCVFFVNPNTCKEERKCFYLTTHSTHFIYGYMVYKHKVKDHSDTERKPAGLFFQINSRSVIYAP